MGCITYFPFETPLLSSWLHQIIYKAIAQDRQYEGDHQVIQTHFPFSTQYNFWLKSTGPILNSIFGQFSQFSENHKWSEKKDDTPKVPLSCLAFRASMQWTLYPSFSLLLINRSHKLACWAEFLLVESNKLIVEMFTRACGGNVFRNPHQYKRRDPLMFKPTPDRKPCKNKAEGWLR